MKRKRCKISWPKVKSWFHLHKATIMSIFASGGVVAVAVLSSKEGVKAYKDLEDFEAANGREPTGFEKAEIILKDHAGAIATGAGTMGLIFSADAVNRKAIGALTGTCVALSRKYDALKRSVEEAHTPEDAEAIMTKAVKEEYKETDVAVSSNKELWYEKNIGYFEASEGDVYKALTALNRSLNVSKCAIFADFVMDVTGIPAGDISPLWWSSGWSYEAMEAGWIDDSFIDITESTIQLDDGLKCRYISFSPSIMPDVCTDDGALIYYITTPM